MFGNGLRPQIWEPFQKRFNVERICEFYGSTEGNANIINMEGKVGAVGFKSLILPSVLPVILIKVDEETGEPIRDKDGLCIECEPGEPGEFVGRIQKNHPLRDFDGYADESATKKKILRDVFKKGDLCFRSGDVLVMDEFGYFYFRDRTGDTFRWRGENVSTSEVEGVLSHILDHKDCVVYGVEVPGCEGRAGMAAIHDPDDDVDLDALAKGMKKALAAFARPVFVRKVRQLDTTGTYKLKKLDLQHEAFDMERVQDPLYFLDPSTGTYVPLDETLYDQILTGKTRL
jgi:solute carrier family 27 fatty acid transporter 1/4